MDTRIPLLGKQQVIELPIVLTPDQRFVTSPAKALISPVAPSSKSLRVAEIQEYLITDACPRCLYPAPYDSLTGGSIRLTFTDA